MSMNEGMATLTEKSHSPHGRAHIYDHPIEAGQDPSKLSRVLVALAIATAIILVVLFALGFTFRPDVVATDVATSLESEVRSWASTHR